MARSDHRYLQTPGVGLQPLQIQEQCPIGFHCEHLHSRTGAHLECHRPDTRNIEPKVVPGFGDLDRHSSAIFSGQAPTPFQTFIGSLKRFHGKDRSTLHHHALANLKTRGLPRDS